MIIRILLLGALAAIGWFVFLRRNRLPFHIFVVFTLLGIGAVAVALPDLTTDVAHLVGVGRGADLITYLVTVVVMFVLLHYYTKFVELQRELTKVTRELRDPAGRGRSAGAARGRARGSGVTRAGYDDALRSGGRGGVGSTTADAEARRTAPGAGCCR